MPVSHIDLFNNLFCHILPLIKKLYFVFQRYVVMYTALLCTPTCYIYVYLYLFQVGNASIDHKSWERPENMMEKRPTLQVDALSPGSDVAAETAAAMASASLVFRKTDSAYSDIDQSCTTIVSVC